MYFVRRARTNYPEAQQPNSINCGPQNHNATYAEQTLVRHHHATICDTTKQSAMNGRDSRPNTETRRLRNTQ